MGSAHGETAAGFCGPASSFTLSARVSESSISLPCCSQAVESELASSAGAAAAVALEVCAVSASVLGEADMTSVVDDVVVSLWSSQTLLWCLSPRLEEGG